MHVRTYVTCVCCVCVCVCVCVCMYVCMYVCVYVCRKTSDLLQHEVCGLMIAAIWMIRNSFDWDHRPLRSFIFTLIKCHNV